MKAKRFLSGLLALVLMVGLLPIMNLETSYAKMDGEQTWYTEIASNSGGYHLSTTARKASIDYSKTKTPLFVGLDTKDGGGSSDIGFVLVGSDNVPTYYGYTSGGKNGPGQDSAYKDYEVCLGVTISPSQIMITAMGYSGTSWYVHDASSGRIPVIPSPNSTVHTGTGTIDAFKEEGNVTDAFATDLKEGLRMAFVLWSEELGSGSVDYDKLMPASIPNIDIMVGTKVNLATGSTWESVTREIISLSDLSGNTDVVNMLQGVIPCGCMVADGTSYPQSEYERRAAAFLHKVYSTVGIDSPLTGIDLTDYFMTPAERAIQLSQTITNVMLDDGSCGSNIYSAARAVAVAYLSAKELDPALSFSTFCAGYSAGDDQQTKNVKAAINLLQGEGYIPGPFTVSYQFESYSVLDTYIWMTVHMDKVSSMQAAINANTDKMVLQTTDTAKIQAAYARVKEQFEKYPDSRNPTDVLDRIQLYIDEYYIAEGISRGVLNTDAFDYITVIPAHALVVSVEGLYEDNAKMPYCAKGLCYQIVILNELAMCVPEMVKLLGSVIDMDGRFSFSGLTDKILGVKSLHDFVEDVDCTGMYEIWTSKSWDTLHEAGEEVSLAYIYEYLLANDAFDRDYNTTTEDVSHPFAYFWNEAKLSPELLKGVVASAQFIPMHTNVYSPSTWTDVADTEWIVNYYAKFGYFRKALYIDTSSDAAVNWVNTGGKGAVQVATLSDLLEDKDIVLYLDTNLYNVNQTSEIVDKAWNRVGQDAASNALGLTDSLASMITGLWDVSMPEIAKSGGTVSYSSRVHYNSTEADKARENGTNPGKWGNFFWPFDGVAKAEENSVEPSSNKEDAAVRNVADFLFPDNVYNPVTGNLYANYESTEYNATFGFAVLSAIYDVEREKNLITDLNGALTRNTPVFVSSGSAPYMSETARTIIYNYALLRNLASVMPVDYSVSLDMTSPIYMDVFGNIVTESGYVVVPSAANATLWASAKYKPRTAAFCYTYGNDYLIPHYDTSSAVGVQSMLTGTTNESLFSLVDGKYVMNSLNTVDGTADIAHLSIADKDTLAALAGTFQYDVNSNNFYNIVLWKMIITEVLRGAPIEYIDKQFEGIQTNVTYTRQGLIVADKLESLVDAIAPAGQNAAIAIPNPAYIEGLEVIVFFIYKLLILSILVVWMVNIYLDATSGVIGLRTAGKCVGVVVLVIAMIVGVPKIFELTYYESNKLLLQDETEYLMMLNLEKKMNGSEIGVSSVSPAETNTKLYLHLADVNMPWWDLFANITVSSSIKSLNDLYQQYENQHPLAYAEDTPVTTKNGGIYIDLDTLFDSANIQFSPTVQAIYVVGAEDTPASYYTPYYYFLDTITKEITSWSKSNNYIAYTTKVQKGGMLKTLGYSTAFFNDADFLEEGQDLFGLYELYNIPAPRQYQYLPVRDPNTLDLLRNSNWCNATKTVEGTRSRIEKLNTYAQEWIANNRGMLGRVSDETFLKCFALSCAMEHNRLFNTQRADYLELQEMSSEDLLRLSIADHNEVMSNSTMSYARFVYTTGGTMAVYVAAVLELVNFISSWVKPAVTLLVFLIACISIFVLKLILRRGNNSIFGYVVTIALMCSVNVLGALFTKLSMYVPTLGFTPTICMLLQIIVQIGYIFLQLKIVSVALRDWKNVGFEHHQMAYNRIRDRGQERTLSRDVRTPKMSSGHEYYDRISNRQLKRRRVA